MMGRHPDSHARSGRMWPLQWSTPMRKAQRLSGSLRKACIRFTVTK